MVNDTAKMLQRLIGEDIELTTVLDPALWPVKADPGQIEQMLDEPGGECPGRHAARAAS